MKNKHATKKEFTLRDAHFPELTPEEKRGFEMLRDPETPVALMRVYSKALQQPMAALVFFEAMPDGGARMWPIGLVVTQEMFESGDLLAPDTNEHGDIVIKEE